MLTGNQRVAEPLCQRVGSSKEGHTRKSALISGPPAAIGVFAFLRAGTVEANGGEVAADRGFAGKRPTAKPGRPVCEGPTRLLGTWVQGAKRDESQCHAYAGVCRHPWQTWAGQGQRLPLPSPGYSLED